jgi:uncharacterized protein Yka (UPF0111/DUF47 family)
MTISPNTVAIAIMLAKELLKAIKARNVRKAERLAGKIVALERSAREGVAA